MGTLEREIIEKFRQLDEASKRRVLDSLAGDLQTTFDYEGWWTEVEAVHLDLRPDASGQVPSVSDQVNEVREEHDANLLRGAGFRSFTGDRTD